ncbi:hypothetical protein [Ekhidna sp.]|uniref:hypothetical protein n=1 Tax=Ekhidna sp. TaxID=2608089 RepID=UPI0032973601
MNSYIHIAPNYTGSLRRSEFDNSYLDPETIKLDRRSTSELLAYISKLSEHFWYYDENDKKKGGWGEFFRSDLTCTLALIGEFRREEDYQKASGFIDNLAYPFPADKEELLYQLFHTVFDSVYHLDRWYKTFKRYHIDHPFFSYLKEIIWQKVSFAFRDLYSFYNFTIQANLVIDKDKIDQEYKRLQDLDPIWNFTPFPKAYQFEPGSGHAELLLEKFQKNIRKDVRSLYNYCQSISSEAKKYFEESLKNSNTEPHIALLISFLKLYKRQQNAFNALVKSQLDFYYKRVLQIHPEGAKPDDSYLTMTLNKGLESFNLPSDTSFLAGVDKNGKPIEFSNAKASELLNTSISDYLTFSIGNDALDNKLFRASTVSRYSKPVIKTGTDLVSTFSMFGLAESNQVKTKSSSLGFAISTPELILEGGDRKVVISFKLGGRVPNKNDGRSLSQDISVALTTKSGWFSPGCDCYALSTKIIQLKRNNKTQKIYILQLIVTLKRTDPAVGIYDSKVHGPGYSSDWPILRLTLRNSISGNDTYGFLSKTQFSKYNIQCFVNDLSKISLITDKGKASPTSSLPLFGSNPVIGSRMLIGCYETFIKKTNKVGINLSWLNLPDQFGTYYEAYNEYIVENTKDTQLTNGAYETQINWLDFSKGRWDSLKTFKLFTGTTVPQLKPFKICGKLSGLEAIEPGLTPVTYESSITVTPDLSLSNPPVYKDSSKSGFLGIELTAPTLTFGASIYPQVVTQVALQKTKKVAEETMLFYLLMKKWLGIFNCKKKPSQDEVKGTDDKPLMPNKPYVPKVKNVSINYTSRNSIEPKKGDVHQFYQIHPFGTEVITKPNSSFITNFQNDKFVYLGLDNLVSGGLLSLFLGIKDRLDAEISDQFSHIIAHVLTDTCWSKIEIKSDETYGLNKSGIIQIDLGKNFSNSNPMMPLGKYWIRLTSNAENLAECHLTMIDTNAVKVARVINNANQSEEFKNTKAGSITTLSSPIPEIAKISQPFGSFGGSNPERTAAYYSRVSNRISGKNRLVSIGDVGNYILDEFPELYQVKTSVEHEDGRKAHVAIIPQLEENATSDPYQPIASAELCATVLSSVQDKISAWLDIEVQPAGLDMIQCYVEVEFKEPYKGNHLKQCLNTDLNLFFSPWIENNALAYKEDTIPVDALKTFIMSRSYVKELIILEVLFNETIYYTGIPHSEIASHNEIIPSSETSTLCSAKNHLIFTPDEFTNSKGNKTRKEVMV